MPVSALSEAALWRLARLLLLMEDEPCHADSQPGTHPGEDALEPGRQKQRTRSQQKQCSQRGGKNNHHANT